MKRRNQDLLLGITAIGMLAMFMGTFLFFYNAPRFDVRPIEVHFRHQEGMVPLVVGGAVMLANSVQVGRVTEIGVKHLETREGIDTFIVVKAEVQQDLRIYKDCRVGSNQPAVGGNGYINIQSLGTPGAVELGDSVIRGLPPESFAAAVTGLSNRVLGEGGLMDQVENMLDPESEASLVFKLSGSLDDVKAITAALRLQLSPTEQEALMAKLHGIIDTVSHMTAALRKELTADDQASTIGRVHLVLDQLHGGLGTVQEILQDSQPALRNTLTHVEQATRSVNEDLIQNLAHEMNAQDPGSLLGKLHQGLTGVNVAVAEMQQVAAAGRRIVVLNEPAVERILKNVTEMSAELNRASNELRLNPSKLIYPPGPSDKRKNAVFDAARDFAIAAGALDNAAARFKAFVDSTPAGADSAAVQQKVQALQVEVQSALGRLNHAEQYLYDQMRGTSP